MYMVMGNDVFEFISIFFNFFFSIYFSLLLIPKSVVTLVGITYILFISVVYSTYLFTCTAYPSRFFTTLFIGEKVTVNNTGISLLLSTSVWALLSPPIERRETRPTA